jgi:hypothetical protein
MKPDAEIKMQIQPNGSFPISNASKLILVYNAWGGVYPGIVDFVHTKVLPKTYPCNLCYQTFGTFRIKEEWLQYLDSLPLKIIELHKEL